MLRCTRNHSFNMVLCTSQPFRSVRLHERKHVEKPRKNCRFGLENRGPGRPGARPDGQLGRKNDVGRARFERETRLERAKSSDFLKSESERGQSERESALWRVEAQ